MGWETNERKIKLATGTYQVGNSPGLCVVVQCLQNSNYCNILNEGPQQLMAAYFFVTMCLQVIHALQGRQIMDFRAALQR